MSASLGSVIQESIPADDSYERAIQKFYSKSSAEAYPWGYSPKLKPQLEKKTVISMLSLFPRRGRILDLPSGTGRVAQLLLERGFEVALADSSPEMVELARQNMKSVDPRWLKRSTYEIQLADKTSYYDSEFDGVICNRLLHHYPDSETRVQVLRELARISRGPVITSIASYSLSSLRKQVVARLRNKSLGDYRPISLAQFRREHAEAGLKVTQIRPVLWGLSRMWYFAGEPE